MYYDVNKTAKLLKKVRVEKGVTQEQASREMGIHIKTLQSAEQGSRGLSIDTLCIMANYYEVSLDYLVTGEFLVSDITRMVEGITNDNKRKLCGIIENLIKTMEW